MSTQSGLASASSGAKAGRLIQPNPTTLLLTVSALAVVINVVGGTLVAMLGIPFLFLDAVGTFLIAAMFGVRWGILVGIVSNLLLGITSGPSAIPFALVQVVIAIIVGGISNRWGYASIRSAAAAGLLVALIAPLVGTAIAVAVFGGLTGGPVDIAVLWLEQAGQEAFGAAFWPRLGQNLIDKVISAFLVLAIIKAIPTTLIKPRRRAQPSAGNSTSQTA